jgi:hypothetical protein
MADGLPQECVETHKKNLSSTFDYIYIARKANSDYNNEAIRGEMLISGLAENKKQYQKVYQSTNVVIFETLK